MTASAPGPARLRHAGVGLRHAHHAQALAGPGAAPEPAFVEVHAENFFGDGGPALKDLQAARARWPVSLHGVGLGLGSAAGLDAWHLDRLARLVERIDPVRVSDHACFARAATQPGGAVQHGCDLLPLAFTPAALAILVRQVQQVQERLRRPILVENLAAYVCWADDAMPEPDFFNALVRHSGCGLLLDVGNLVVNACNRFPGDMASAVASACAWIDRIAPAAVGQIHLAGHDASGDLVIDDHGGPVAAAAWQVFGHALRRLGPRPTLIEWDQALPSWPRLLQEAAQADALIATPCPAASLQAGPPPPGPPALPADPAAGAREAARQQWLLRRLADAAPGSTAADWLAGPADRQQLGLQVYQANAAATAIRALAAAYPTVQLLLGTEPFAALAQRLWRLQPPARGDLAAWGAGLPAHIASLPALAGEPYLADMAHLDWACHSAQQAADDAAPTVGLALLGEADPAQLWLRLRAGHAVLVSDHPLQLLWAAHRSTADDRFAAARAALAAGRGQAVRVARQGATVVVEAIDAATAAFERDLLRGRPLAAALTAADPAFGFEPWLIDSLQRGALAAVLQQPPGNAAAQ